MAYTFIDHRVSAKRLTKEEAVKLVMRKALQVERNARASMTGGGKPHQPSSPGQPPHVDTGRLRSSIDHEMVISGDTVIVRVGTNVKYGRYLELGTRYIEPRPWLIPALAKAVGEK